MTTLFAFLIAVVSVGSVLSWLTVLSYDDEIEEESSKPQSKLPNIKLEGGIGDDDDEELPPSSGG